MTTLEVFDPAMCCSTGECGVDVDPVLVQYAAALEWVAGQGVDVRRDNLVPPPRDFAANPVVLKGMEAGVDCLPVVVVDALMQKLKLALPRENRLCNRVGAGRCRWL